MSKQWFRTYQMIVGSGGQGISIDNLGIAGLKVRFEIMKSLMKEPNEAKFEIFNLNPQHAQAFESEYTDLIFKAGYDDNVQTLFSGNTQYVSNYRDKTDWITEVICGDGDKVFRTVYVNKTYAAGTKDESIVDDIKTLLGTSIRKGMMQLLDNVNLRGRTFSKSAQESLDEIAKTNGCNWSIQDGELQMVRADDMINPGQATLLTPETGLLEAAERTDKGITARCLLNPDIKVNTAVRLDNSAIKTQSRNRKSITKDQKGRVVELSPDGIYKVFKVRHSGDTRANDWVTEILCVAVGQPISTTQADKSGAVPITGSGASDQALLNQIYQLRQRAEEEYRQGWIESAGNKIKQALTLAQRIQNTSTRQRITQQLNNDLAQLTGRL